MKVILRADVANVGRKGDLLDVADGLGRNYLLPKQLALVATKGAVAQAESMRRSRDRKEARDRDSATELAGRFSAAVVGIPARAGADGRLFGSVTSADVAEAVAAQVGIELDRRKLHLDEPIRTTGRHELTLRLHPEVEARITVEVTPRT